MIDFDTDKEIVETVKRKLKEEINEYRDNICSYFHEFGVDSERYIEISLAKIYSNAKDICVPEIMNKREMPPEPKEESEKEWYEYLKKDREMQENIKIKLEAEIKEVESHIFSYAEGKGLQDKMNTIKALVILYKMKCYHFGYCSFYAPEPQRVNGPGRFPF
ncbi:hypothetical protein COJ01_17185 [Priestia megaterium]|uniref:hypothetical protein n=1 Tax=Priestia megaterium TaxID=1404 RepID=UPI000BF44A70|nr:hypothetical protein [Priestia megaterium]PFK99806.1 hypothetical protein COJ01_17185 [Priestia megaterium]